MKTLPLAVSAVLFASTSWASPTYPATVQQELGLQAPPLCTTCHSSMAGGLGTAVQPVAITLRKNGLVHQNPDLLKTLLAKSAADGFDSDKDGTADIAELKAGTDPNKNETKLAAAAVKPSAVAPSGTSAPVAKSGCAAVPVGSFGAALGLSVLALLSRRRSRRA